MHEDFKQKVYYPFLDGFRAVAIIWVMLHHAMPFIPNLEFLGWLGKIVVRLGEIGFFGVDIFFVISGFLITGLLIGDVQNKIRIKRFYMRRFFKIVPHYLLFVVGGLLLLPFVAPQETLQPFNVFSYLFFFQNYVVPIASLAHLWSIAIEEHFYLGYALLLALICRLTSNIKIRFIVLFAVLLTLILAVNVIRNTFFMSDPGPYRPPLPFQQTHMRFDALIFGCLIKLIEPYLFKIPRWLAFVFKHSFVVIGLAPLVYLYFHYYKYSAMSYTMVYVATGFSMMAALLKQNPLCFITELGFLRWIGKNSYGIYLWHYPIARIIFNLQDRILGLLESWMLVKSLGIVVMVILYAGLSISLGVLTTVTVERYFLNLRQKVIP